MPASFNRNRLWIQKYFYFKHSLILSIKTATIFIYPK
jgi:hypothetical protein